MQFSIRQFVQITLCLVLVTIPLTETFGTGYLPFLSRNQSPLIQIFGVPVPAAADMSADGEVHLNLAGKIANNHSWDFTSDKLVYFDGETQKLLVQTGYTFNSQFSLGASTTLMHHSGGFTDDFIYHFHRTFRLPQGRRERQYNGNLNYVYRSDEITRLWLSDSNLLFGDTQIFLGVSLKKPEKVTRFSANLQGGVKLPTGNPEHLTGSGSIDLWSRVSAEHSFVFKNIPSSLYFSTGFLRPGKFAPLHDIQRRLISFGAGGIGLDLFPWITIQSQIDWHTPFYKSEFNQIGMFSGQIITGATIRVSDLLQLQVGVAEDVLISTASDVVFYAGLRTLVR